MSSFMRRLRSGCRMASRLREIERENRSLRKELEDRNEENAFLSDRLILAWRDLVSLRSVANSGHCIMYRWTVIDECSVRPEVISGVSPEGVETRKDWCSLVLNGIIKGLDPINVPRKGIKQKIWHNR